MEDYQIYFWQIIYPNSINMRIIIWYVLLGLFLGFLIIYLTSPPPKVVIKYPTIENIGNTTYVDENGQCYKYYAREISCPVNGPVASPSVI